MSLGVTLQEKCILQSISLFCDILSNELTNQQFLGEGPESKALLDLGLQVVYAPMVMIHQWYEVMGELRETLL